MNQPKGFHWKIASAKLIDPKTGEEIPLETDGQNMIYRSAFTPKEPIGSIQWDFEAMAQGQLDGLAGMFDLPKEPIFAIRIWTRRSKLRNTVLWLGKERGQLMRLRGILGLPRVTISKKDEPSEE